MRKTVTILSVILASALSTAVANEVEGKWEGTLSLGARGSLKLALNITEDRHVTLDSPEQGAFGIKCDSEFIENSIKITVPKLMMTYAGKIDGDSISGYFQQGLTTLPLTFRRVGESPGSGDIDSPSFKEEEIKVENRVGGSTLAGTLTLPDRFISGKTPLAILISGSGLQNRDGEIFGKKPFKQIAHENAANGIATFRYDDRGFGESTGDIGSATTADFASDASAILDWFRNQDDYKFGKIGVIGHSEGGIIAYMLATADNRPDFIVSIAGPVIKGTKTIAYQNKIALVESGLSNYANDFEAAIERTLEYKLANPNISRISDKQLSELYPQCNDSDTCRQLAQSLRNIIEQGSQNKWMDFFLNYDPAKEVAEMKIPALIIYGERDCQVPPLLNYELATRLAPDATIKVEPGVNHLMQQCESGSVTEYANNNNGMAERVISEIIRFINGQ